MPHPTYRNLDHGCKARGLWTLALSWPISWKCMTLIIYWNLITFEYRKDMAVVFCAILISLVLYDILFCSNVYILCLKHYWQSKEMMDLIRLRSMIIKNGGTSSSIYPIMAALCCHYVFNHAK